MDENLGYFKDMLWILFFFFFINALTDHIILRGTYLGKGLFLFFITGSITIALIIVIMEIIYYFKLNYEKVSSETNISESKIKDLQDEIKIIKKRAINEMRIEIRKIRRERLIQAEMRLINAEIKTKS